ncbi:uncharacterized protein LOC123037339 [Drosophila rhopaloa]|uniref:CCHC-type domain-containing protein n=1 Tax=Drosophila rhopaloa TaxID=1041015 RepID=A0ABM5J3I8_DRORH|nr:uncharacterized protein LOC123037339 [Drosophila rhopaloa]
MVDPGDAAAGSEVNTSKLVSLRHQRTTITRNMTNLKTKLDKEKETLNVPGLECYLQILEGHFGQLSTTQGQIENLHSADTERSSLDELFVEIKTTLLAAISRKRRESIPGDTTLNSSFNSSVMHHNRLPNLKLPSFDGKIAQTTNVSLVHFQISWKRMVAFRISTNYRRKLLEGNGSVEARYDNDVFIFLDYISNLFAVPTIENANAAKLLNVVDTISAIRSSVLSLGSAANVMDAIIIHLMLGKLDPETKMQYQERQSYDQLPSWDDCCGFLTRRCQYLEARERDHPVGGTDIPTLSSSKQPRKSKAFMTVNATCVYCKGSSHYISSCTAFNKCNPNERTSFAKRTHLCLNCLRPNHILKECKSKSRCKMCHASHHTLLHESSHLATYFSSIENPQDQLNVAIQHNQESVQLNSNVALLTRASKQGVLPTAVIQIKDVTGNYQLVRALLDSCSEVNLITEETAKRLNLHKARVSQAVSGISEACESIPDNVFATLKSRISNFQWSSEFGVIKRICSRQPREYIDTSTWKLPEGIMLAPPDSSNRTKSTSL